MDISDSVYIRNLDWDPSYLKSIFDIEFDNYSDLWCSEMDDTELVNTVTELEKYFPIVEDISLDDIDLCNAVEKVESK